VVLHPKTTRSVPVSDATAAVVSVAGGGSGQHKDATRFARTMYNDDDNDNNNGGDNIQ